MVRQAAALRDFSPLYVRFGSFASDLTPPVVLNVRSTPKADNSTNPALWSEHRICPPAGPERQRVDVLTV
jgi:hypothetical protein